MRYIFTLMVNWSGIAPVRNKKASGFTFSLKCVQFHDHVFLFLEFSNFFHRFFHFADKMCENVLTIYFQLRF